MTCAEVFSKIDAHMKTGMILHDQLANYYDFLGLMGFKRLHEYHFLREAASMRGLNRYVINHHNMLIDVGEMHIESAIPQAWHKSTRRDVGISTKRSAVKSGMEMWAEWERKTKKLYEECYCALCDAGEIAAACKVRQLVADVDMELKEADRLALKMQAIDYDMPTMILMQDEMHECYREKEKSVGVDIC